MTDDLSFSSRRVCSVFQAEREKLTHHWAVLNRPNALHFELRLLKEFLVGTLQKGPGNIHLYEAVDVSLFGVERTGNMRCFCAGFVCVIGRFLRIIRSCSAATEAKFANDIYKDRRNGQKFSWRAVESVLK